MQSRLSFPVCLLEQYLTQPWGCKANTRPSFALQLENSPVLFSSQHLKNTLFRDIAMKGIWTAHTIRYQPDASRCTRSSWNCILDNFCTSFGISCCPFPSQFLGRLGLFSEKLPYFAKPKFRGSVFSLELAPICDSLFIDAAIVKHERATSKRATEIIETLSF